MFTASTIKAPTAATVPLTGVGMTGVVTNQIDTQPTTPRVSAFAAVMPASATPPANPVASFLVLPATLISTVTNVVAAVLSSFVAPVPGAPPNPPLLWAVLEVVRREFFNQTPQITYTASKPDALGNITISLNQTDADGDTLRYTATNGDKGTVAPNADGHSFTYTPDPGQTGTDTITVTASDATNAHIHGLPGLINALTFGLLGDAGDTATTNITVKLNTPPTLTLTSGAPDQSTGKVTVNAVATDPDTDPLSFTITPPAGGSGAVGTPTLVDAATGTYAIVYTPTDQARHTASSDTATPAQQADSFTVSVNDGHGATVTKTATVTISPANAAPQFSTITTKTDSNGVVTGAVVFTDSDADTLTYSGSTTSTKGSVVVDPSGTFTYTPTDNARFAATATDGPSTDTFNATANDGHGGVVTKPVTVTITPEDITSNPKAAILAMQPVVTDQIDAWGTAKTNLEATITSIDPTLNAADLNLTKAKVQVLITAGLAQLNINIQDPNPGPTPQLGSDAKKALETTLGGPLTQTQVDSLTADAMAVASSERRLKKPLDTSADAGALATYNAAGDGKPVFSRVQYTVAADGSVTGRVFFVDPNNDPAHPLVIGSPSEDAQFLDPTTPGSFTMPAPDPNNPAIPNIVTFHVTATDSDGNVVTQSITVDRTPRLPTSLSDPSKTYSFGAMVTALNGIIRGGGDVYSGVLNYQAAQDTADAKDLQAQAKVKDAVLQGFDSIINLAITNLAQASSEFSTTLDQTASTTASVQDLVKNRVNSV